MKEGWERKKIKEVADVIGGSTPKTNVEEYWGGNNYWVTPAELDGSKYIEKTVRCITSNAVDKTNLTLMPSGTVLLSSRAPIGKVCITKAPMYCNQGFKNLICKELLYNEFAYYFLKHNVDYLQSLGTGATFKEISKKVVENVTIPVPPLSEQQHIVEELDLLSSIIEKKKTQLRELDNLAQSLFYEMFNEEFAIKQNWRKCHVGDVYKFQYGKGNKIPEDKGNYLCYGSNGVVGHHTTFNSEDAPIIGHIGAYAGIVNWGIGKHYVTYNGVICKLKEDCNNPIYGYYMLKSQDYLNIAKRGGAQPFVSYDLLEEPTIYVPPLDLQNQFASKIEAIEHQKELIKQSIKEVETLFNSRMDYYFN